MNRMCSSAWRWLWQEPGYQTLPFLMEHKLGGNKAILVMSPLVALMEDQVYRLKKHGVRASIVSSSTSVADDNIATVGRDFFFSESPYHSGEMPLKERDFSSCIVAIAVDEAHCVSKIRSIMDLVSFRIIFNTHAS